FPTELRRVPGESEGARRHRLGASTRGGEVRGELDADVFHQRKYPSRRDDARGDREGAPAVSQELTRVFRPADALSFRRLRADGIIVAMQKFRKMPTPRCIVRIA